VGGLGFRTWEVNRKVLLVFRYNVAINFLLLLQPPQCRCSAITSATLNSHPPRTSIKLLELTTPCLRVLMQPRCALCGVRPSLLVSRSALVLLCATACSPVYAVPGLQVLMCCDLAVLLRCLYVLGCRVTVWVIIVGILMTDMDCS